MQAELRRLRSDLRGAAMAAALNKTADKARAEISRAIRQEFAVAPERVRNSIRVSGAAATSEARLQAVLTLFGSSSKRGRSLNLIHFLESKVTLAEHARRIKALTQKDLRFRIKRGGPLVTVPGAFLLPNGRTVMHRTGPGRLPIAPLQVIDIQQMFNTKRISARVLAKINADLPVEVQRAVKWMLSKK
ncbi:MAG: phage tail protein [Burkholderiales bacterium]|nr:phage tail protein [Burkholderiales bacterium]